MSDAPRLLDASGKPATSATQAQAQVQPADNAGPKNRYRGVYLLMPQGMYRALEQAHAGLAPFNRAPGDFAEFMLVLISQGAQTFIPHAQAEIEAEMRAQLEASLKWAQETVNSETASEEDKKKAHELLADYEMKKQEFEQAQGEQTVRDTPAPVPASPIADERPPREIISNTQAEAEAIAAEEAAGKAALEAALAATPEVEKP